MFDNGNSTSDLREQRTARLAENALQENVISLKFGPDFLDELTGLSQSKRLFDIVVIDCTSGGFLFVAETLIEAAALAKILLELKGAMLFVKPDKAIALIRESIVGQLAFHVFDTLSQLYDYAPNLGSQVQLTLGTKAEINKESSDLSEHILMSSIPVMTTFGIKLKVGMETASRRNVVLAAIDNYTPISALAHKLSPKLSFADLDAELHALEASGAIFPLFARIPFLVHCFRNKLPFKLKEYLFESRLITQDHLDGLFFSVTNSKASERLSLGALCVSKGFISSRQLEIALQDHAFYGQGGEGEKVRIFVDQDQESKVDSLVGHLGSTEAAGVLQSLANNRESGVLSVEHKDMQFRAVFEQGKLLKARQGKLLGNDAVVEFVSTWKDGIFVFLERQTPADLAADACNVTRPVDNLLLDSALASDNIEKAWRALPKGGDTAVEKMEDVTNLFGSGNMIDPQESYPLSANDIRIMLTLWNQFDGLVSVLQTIKKAGDITTAHAASAIMRLLHYNLVKVSVVDLTAPLEKFQAIVYNVANFIGVERSNALLRLSLQASQGYSAKARMFQIGTGGEVGVDLSLARMAQLSLSEVVKQLEDWQVNYIEYASHEIDINMLRDIVSLVYKGQSPGPL